METSSTAPGRRGAGPTWASPTAKVVRIGTIDDEAAETIDATGKVVTPGFVDVHTHFDAQVFWDGALTPSPLHGVTTVLAGNCGFTIAPLSDDPADGDYLMRMLARVEGMPLESLRTGVPWNWTTHRRVLRRDRRHARHQRRVHGRPLGDPPRRDGRGVASAARPTPDELDAMQRLLRAGLDAGGLGFSSSWARTHNDADGHMVPSRYATARRDRRAVRASRGEFEGTSLEFIPQVGPKFDAVGDRAHGRHVGRRAARRSTGTS